MLCTQVLQVRTGVALRIELRSVLGLGDAEFGLEDLGVVGYLHEFGRVGIARLRPFLKGGTDDQQPVVI